MHQKQQSPITRTEKNSNSNSNAIINGSIPKNDELKQINFDKGIDVDRTNVVN